MPVERFFLPAEYSVHEQVCLHDEEHHHLARVVRMKVGEEVELVNGKGGLAGAVVQEIAKQMTTLEVRTVTVEPPPQARVLAAIPFMRPSKLEWVVEKGTELGADAFLLYPAERSEKGELNERSLERLRKLSIAALKQSGRLFLPGLEVLSHLSDVFMRDGTFLFGDVRPSATRFKSPMTTTIFITGPEGGFSPKELTLLESKAVGVRLSPYVLRAETAPIVALSLLGAQVI